MSKKQKSPNRHLARESAIEALYAWHNGGNDETTIPDFLSDRIRQEEKKGQDEDYLREIVYGVSESYKILDEMIGKAVQGRSLKSIAHIELNVLRIAVWELQNRLEIPYRVIINEALELTRAYADEPSRGFINGVIDKVAKEVRASEVKAA